MALEPKLIELLIVKAAELRRQAAERPDQPELRGDDIDDQTEPGLLRERQAMLGFTLHLNERISRREKVRVQLVAAIRGKGEVTDLVRGIERATHQIAAGPDMSRPRHDDSSEGHIGTGLEARQPTLFDQLHSRAGRIEIRPGSCRSAVRR